MPKKTSDERDAGGYPKAIENDWGLFLFLSHIAIFQSLSNDLSLFVVSVARSMLTAMRGQHDALNLINCDDADPFSRRLGVGDDIQACDDDVLLYRAANALSHILYHDVERVGSSGRRNSFSILL